MGEPSWKISTVLLLVLVVVVVLVATHDREEGNPRNFH